MRRPPFKLLGAALLALALAGTATAPALAHERRTVGAYQFVVGWKVEPAFSDADNAVQIFVRDGAGNPVTDAADTVKVEVIQGTQKTDALPLKTVFNSPGEYNAPVLPTRPGTYTFHFTGSIHDQKVDEMFTSSDKTFNNVENAGAIQFPAKDPSRGEIAQRIERSDSRIDGNQKAITALQAQLAKAQQDANNDRTLAVVGLALGALGTIALIVLVVVALRRRRASAPEAAAVPSEA